MTESALRNINRSFEEAAENLGCSRLERLFKITLPLVMSGIAAARSTILLVSSGLCVFVVLRFSQSKEGAFV